MGERKDFVKVKLSAAGERLADGAPLSIANARWHFTFTPGESVEVTRVLEWESFLALEALNGEPLFELAQGITQQ